MRHETPTFLYLARIQLTACLQIAKYMRSNQAVFYPCVFIQLFSIGVAKFVLNRLERMVFYRSWMGWEIPIFGIHACVLTKLRLY
jgi:hypothetical protein